ncbi:hypothetical protein [Amycolatopsis sp. Poz14]|uniref:hypothetical protein n=1 Tax=Amycolatopsis sp. Poz14 TaxID=1447705 RepID=UPI001EE800DA|nr:hypothetical protein [Amycolatopsis sp. Poz14]MCG3749975.1 hypothetical protein [Amycolatopsis sp. Poz14]
MSGRRPIVLVAALVFALSGCTSTKTGTAAPASTVSQPAASPATPASSSSAAPVKVEYTKQGTKLKIGEKAVVPFKSPVAGPGAIGVTVTGIDKGDAADLTPLKLGDQAAGMTPYYVRLKVTNESGTDFYSTSVGLMYGLLEDGSKAAFVTIIGTFEKCDNARGGQDFSTVGATYDSCVLALAPEGSTVTGAKYSDTNYVGLAPDTDYGKAAIVWQP